MHIDVASPLFGDDGLNGNGKDIFDATNEDATGTSHGGLEKFIEFSGEANGDAVFAEIGVHPTAVFGGDGDLFDGTFKGTSGQCVDGDGDFLFTFDL